MAEAWLSDLRRKYNERAEVAAQAEEALAGLSHTEQMLLEYFPPPNRQVLTVGCGAGREAIALAEQGWQVTGIDLAALPLSVCQDLLSRRGLKAELILLEEALPWPVPPAAFGAVLLYGQILEHLPACEARRALLAEAKRVLVPGGRLYLGTHAVQSADITELSALAPDPDKPGDILAGHISRARSPGRLHLHLYSLDELIADLQTAGLGPLTWLIQQEDGPEHPVWRRFLYVAAGVKG